MLIPKDIVISRKGKKLLWSIMYGKLSKFNRET